MLRMAIALCVLLAFGSGASAEKRVALVIGNGSYKAENLLINPPNDARLIGQALARAQFETIETKVNLGIADFRQALRRFQSQANGAEVALVYFAGHGIEANGVDWLIPTDAELYEDRDLDYEAIKADLVLQALQGARMRVLVLDACRNNPFGRNWRVSVRSTTTGLAKLEADDVLVLFAAAPGRTARDGDSVNSPFAETLAKRLPEPGLAIQLLGGNVRDDVLAATGGDQRPYVSASITGKPFYLVPMEHPNAEAKQAPPPTAAGAPSSGPSEAAEAWTLTKDTTRPTDLETFIRRFGDTYYGELAKGRLEELRSEQQRLALFQKQEADRNRAEAVDADKAALDRKKAEEELARKAEAKRKAEMEADNKKAEPQDTHGLLGTWKCRAISPNYNKNGEKVSIFSCSSTVEFERFDGEFYWVSSRGTCEARLVKGTERRHMSFSSKSKSWFVGDKLMFLLYSSSDKNDPGLNKTLDYRFQNGKYTGVFSGKSPVYTFRSTVVCTK
jgi:uncharacterized caspase-like protein